MLAMLLMCHYNDIPGPNEIHDKLVDLKQVVMCERKAFPLVYLKIFPDDPQELPSEVFSYAYSDSQPIPCVLPGINSIAKKIALRGNSQLLKQSPKAKVEPLQAASSSGLAQQPLKIEPCQPATESIKTHDDFPVRGDMVEEQLYSKYKADLWKHRAQKQGILLGGCKEEQGQPSGAVPLKMEGAPLTLTPRMHAHQLPSDEPPHEASTKLEEAADKQPEPKAEAVDEADSDLDPYAAAAMNALTARNARNK